MVNDSIRSLHSTFPHDAIPKRCDGYQINKISCCFLLQDHRTRHTLKLNESATIIWNLCSGELSVGEILELLTESYPEAASDMAKDLYRVLDEFEEEGVITFSPRKIEET